MQHIVLLAGTYIMYIHRPEPCGPASGSPSFISAISTSYQFYQLLSFPHRVTRLPSCRGLVPFVLPWSSPHPLTYYTPPSVNSTISSPPYLLYTPLSAFNRSACFGLPHPHGWQWAKVLRKKYVVYIGWQDKEMERGSIDERWWGGQR